MGLIEKIVSGLEWRPLHAVDQTRFREARLQAHHAVQWLARTARAYIPPQPDDSHTSLSWDRSIDGFMTHALIDGTRLSLQVVNLTLALYEGGKAGNIHSLSLSGRHDKSIREWLGELLGARGLNPQALDAPSPYEIPAKAIAQGAKYDLIGWKDALAELAAWFANAELSLSHVQRQMMAQKFAVSSVRCWPHHFDLSTLTTLPVRAAETTGHVGVGLSPGDEYYNEPYFYISVYPDPHSAMLPALPKFGHWHTHEFTAAVMPARRLLTAQDQRVETDDFLQAAVTAAIKLLS
jgi:hypothetical protein